MRIFAIMNTFEHNKKRALLLAALGAIGVALVFLVKPDKKEWHKPAGIVWNTEYHITYLGTTDLSDSINATFRRVELSVSPFNKASLITAVNDNRTDRLDSALITLYNTSKAINSDSHGAFDPTLSPLINAWGFGFKTGNPPTQQTVDSLRAIVGFQKVTLKEEHVKKQNPHIMLDCSAIAKGYGSDIVARFLKKKGIQTFMVENGGEIVVNGNSDKQVPWRVGINKPTDDSLNTNQELQDVINVTDIAMATSGNYRIFYYKNGKKYTHTIDPKTGYPVQHNILSATVLAKNCATADAYATSFMVMGLDGARKVLEKHPELDAYLIYSDEQGNNRIWYSPELKKKILK